MENGIFSLVFNGNNWHNWSYRMEVDLRALKLSHCIERKLEEEPFFLVDAADGDAEQARKEALRKSRKEEDEKCKMFLLGRIAGPQKEIVRGMSSPKSIWEALEKLSGRKRVRAGCNGTFPFKCRACLKPGHKKVDCPEVKKLDQAAGSLEQQMKGTAHSAGNKAGAGEDVSFGYAADEAKNVEAHGKFQRLLESGASEHVVGGNRGNDLLVNVRRKEDPKLAAGRVEQRKVKALTAGIKASDRENLPFGKEAEEANSEEVNGKFQGALDSVASEDLIGGGNLLVNVRRKEPLRMFNGTKVEVTQESSYVEKVTNDGVSLEGVSANEKVTKADLSQEGRCIGKKVAKANVLLEDHHVGKKVAEVEVLLEGHYEGDVEKKASVGTRKLVEHEVDGRFDRQGARIIEKVNLEEEVLEEDPVFEQNSVPEENVVPEDVKLVPERRSRRARKRPAEASADRRVESCKRMCGMKKTVRYKTVIMRQPPGFERGRKLDELDPGKSLYGMNQEKTSLEAIVKQAREKDEEEEHPCHERSVLLSSCADISNVTNLSRFQYAVYDVRWSHLKHMRRYLEQTNSSRCIRTSDLFADVPRAN